MINSWLINRGKSHKKKLLWHNLSFFLFVYLNRLPQNQLLIFKFSLFFSLLFISWSVSELSTSRGPHLTWTTAISVLFVTPFPHFLTSVLWEQPYLCSIRVCVWYIYGFYSVLQTHRTDADRCAVNALPSDGFSHYAATCFFLKESWSERLKCLPSHIYQIFGVLPGEVHLPWLLFTDTHILTGRRESNYLPTSHLCSRRALLKWLAAEMHTDIYFSFMFATLIPTNSNF